MVRKEIRELCSEELLLLRRLQEYGKTHSIVHNERVEGISLLLLFRIYSNLISAYNLSILAIKNEKFTVFLFPIGIILRCAFTDCLFALYLLSVKKERAYEELDLRAKEYGDSLLERKEVYRDMVKSTDLVESDEFIDYMWELQMEDSFLHLLTLHASSKGPEVARKSKEQLSKEGFIQLHSISTKDIYNFLIQQEGLNETATLLYHYYKYFSQYEHFSENGQGDILAMAKENGHGNVHLPSAIRALSVGVKEVIQRRAL